MTNNRPVVEEDTEAVWRRIRLVPFNVTIPPEERDARLGETLAAERSGILNWCLAGLERFLSRGLPAPADVTIATDEYRADSADHFDDFQAECLLNGDPFSVSRAALTESYLDWVDRHHIRRPLDRGSLFERVRRLGGVTEASRRTDKRIDRIFRGIGLRVGSTEGERHAGF